MAHVISDRQPIGGWGIPETVAKELAEILEAKWGGSMQKLADEIGVKHSTVYGILAQGTGNSSLDLIEKMAEALGSTKEEVAQYKNALAKALSKKTPEQRKTALNAVCKKAGISLNELNTRCWGKDSYIYQVINSNKRTQNFLKLVAAFELDLVRFEEHYKGTKSAA